MCFSYLWRHSDHLQNSSGKGQRWTCHSHIWHNSVSVMYRLRQWLCSSQSTTRKDGLQYRCTTHRRLLGKDEHGSLWQFSRNCWSDSKSTTHLQARLMLTVVGRLQDIPQHHTNSHELDSWQQIILPSLWWESIGRFCRTSRWWSRPGWIVVFQHSLWCAKRSTWDGDCSLRIRNNADSLQVQISVEAHFVSDVLRGNDTTEMRVTLLRYIEDEMPPEDDWSSSTSDLQLQ